MDLEPLEEPIFSPELEAAAELFAAAQDRLCEDPEADLGWIVEAVPTEEKSSFLGALEMAEFFTRFIRSMPSLNTERRNVPCSPSLPN